MKEPSCITVQWTGRFVETPELRPKGDCPATTEDEPLLSGRGLRNVHPTVFWYQTGFICLGSRCSVSLSLLTNAGQYKTRRQLVQRESPPGTRGHGAPGACTKPGPDLGAAATAQPSLPRDGETSFCDGYVHVMKTYTPLTESWSSQKLVLAVTIFTCIYPFPQRGN